MFDTNRSICILIFLMLLCFIAGVTTTWLHRCPVCEHTYVATAVDLQELLVSNGYDIEVDGIIGTNTVDALNQFMNDGLGILFYERTTVSNNNDLSW